MTRKTTFLHALMPEPSDSRGKKKVLALLSGAGYSKTFPFCLLKLIFFSVWTWDLPHGHFTLRQVLKWACASAPPSHPPKGLHHEKSQTSSRGNRMQQEWMRNLWGPHPLWASFRIPATSWPYTEVFAPGTSEGGLSISLAYSGKWLFKSPF